MTCSFATAPTAAFAAALELLLDFAAFLPGQQLPLPNAAAPPSVPLQLGFSWGSVAPAQLEAALAGACLQATGVRSFQARGGVLHKVLSTSRSNP